MSAVFAVSATSPVYLRDRKDRGSAANRRSGPGADVELFDHIRQWGGESDRSMDLSFSLFERPSSPVRPVR
jgi:hypothetical protein